MTEKRYSWFLILLFLCLALGIVIKTVQYNLSINTFAESSTFPVIVIDAGHGGEDGGASTADGMAESHINLEISKRLEYMLALTGIKPFMLRTEDTALYSGPCTSYSEKKSSDLKNRVNMVNGIPNAVLISIHQNYFPEEKYSGAQVFYAPTTGSKKFAEMTQESLRISLSANNQRKIKPADSVFLMNKVQCSAILVECGFLSNTKEAQLLQNPIYQKKLVCGICAAAGKYLEGEKGPNEI